MNSHFMKNISGWIERLENIEKMIKFSIPYETIIEKYQKYSQ